MPAIFTGITGCLDKVGVVEVDVTYFGFSMAFDILCHIHQTVMVLPDWMGYNLAEESS